MINIFTQISKHLLDIPLMIDKRNEFLSLWMMIIGQEPDWRFIGYQAEDNGLNEYCNNGNCEYELP